MCDCYEHKCDVITCNEKIPIHIADFNTPRENVLVYCTRHIPKNFIGNIYKVTKTSGSHNLPKGYKIGIAIKNANLLSKEYVTCDPAPRGKTTSATPNIYSVYLIKE